MPEQTSQSVLVTMAAGHLALDALTLATGLSRKPLNNAVQRLQARGFIQIVSPGHYLITEAGLLWLAEGRAIAGGQGRRFIQRTSGLRERGWWLMRELRHFTLPDLLATLATGDERAADSNLRRYLTALERVGVIVRAKRRVACPTATEGLILWRLARDLGRHAPVHRQRHGAVFDPNSGEVLPMQEVSHDAS